MWLMTATALIAGAHMRWGIGLLGWLVPVPAMRYLRTKAGWRSRTLLAIALVSGWTLATLKIATPPLSPWFAVPIGLQLGLEQTVGYLSWDAIRRRVGEPIAALSFAAVMTL